MADIKKTANKVRSKLKGNSRLAFCFYHDICADNDVGTDDICSHRTEHRTRRANEQIVGRSADTQNAAFDTVPQIRRGHDGVQPHADRLPRAMQRSHPAPARNQ